MDPDWTFGYIFLPCKVYHEVPSLKLTASLHLFKWMVGLQAFPIRVSALFFRGTLLVYQRLMVSKVVSTHLWNTPRETSTNRAMNKNSFHSCLGGLFGVRIFLGWLDPFKATDLRCRLKRQSVAKVMLIWGWRVFLRCEAVMPLENTGAWFFGEKMG